MTTEAPAITCDLPPTYGAPPTCGRCEKPIVGCAFWKPGSGPMSWPHTWRCYDCISPEADAIDQARFEKLLGRSARVVAEDDELAGDLWREAFEGMREREDWEAREGEI